MRWSNHPPLQHWFALVEHRAANCGDAFHAMGRISHLTSNDEIIGLPADLFASFRYVPLCSMGQP